MKIQNKLIRLQHTRVINEGALTKRIYTNIYNIYTKLFCITFVI
jgi:hypothetical protein